MGNVNFYLKTPAKVTGKSLIYLKYKYSGRVLVYTFGQNINPSNWSEKKQRVKTNRETTADGQHSLNDLLDTLVNITKSAYNKEMVNGIPEPDTLKKYLDDFVNQRDASNKPTLYDLIERFINGEIKFRGKNKSEETIRVYTTTRNHLKEFEAIKNYSINFDSITLDFYYKFLEYLENRGSKYKAAIQALRKNNPKLKNKAIIDLDINSIGKYISKLKVFMGEAIDLKMTTNREFENKKFMVPREDTEAIYLNDREIERLYKFDLSFNQRLERVRDLFVFGCFVGLRFQDYSSIKPENIVQIENDDSKQEYFLKVKTQKTGELVYIPCNPIVLEIFQKYGDNANKLPPSISNQNFNEYIKEACKIAGLTDKGRLLEEPDKETWESVSSHTARRSFATNYYLDNFPTIDLMKITGHKTEKAFLTYIRVSKLDTAKRLNEHMKKRWETKKQKALLRVA